MLIAMGAAAITSILLLALPLSKIISHKSNMWTPVFIGGLLSALAVMGLGAALLVTTVTVPILTGLLIAGIALAAVEFIGALGVLYTNINSYRDSRDDASTSRRTKGDHLDNPEDTRSQSYRHPRDSSRCYSTGNMVGPDVLSSGAAGESLIGTEAGRGGYGSSSTLSRGRGPVNSDLFSPDPTSSLGSSSIVPQGYARNSRERGQISGGELDLDVIAGKLESLRKSHDGIDYSFHHGNQVRNVCDNLRSLKKVISNKGGGKVIYCDRDTSNHLSAGEAATKIADLIEGNNNEYINEYFDKEHYEKSQLLSYLRGVAADENQVDLTGRDMPAIS